MIKIEAIKSINCKLGGTVLNRDNAHWANVIQYGSHKGWWLNIPFHKFAQDLHLILNCAELHQYIHIKVPANSIREPRNRFRNKDDSADIFMPSNGSNRLVDVQSGSSRHDFRKYMAVEYAYHSK